ncbi:MAG: hypothetical protein HRT45_05035 [Bdellovibrionales bacterium]|nr:hypothetical protein [Bdellovibrionales bacterium]
MQFRFRRAALLLASLSFILSFQAHAVPKCGSELHDSIDLEDTVEAIDTISRMGFGSYLVKEKTLLIPDRARQFMPRLEAAKVTITLYKDDPEDEGQQTELEVLVQVINPNTREEIDSIEFLEVFLPLSRAKQILKSSVKSPVALVPSFITRPVFEESDHEAPHWIEIGTKHLTQDELLTYLEAFGDYLDQRAERLIQLRQDGQL